MIPAKADIVVIGSGPSGCMAAGLLAKAGYDVVILEKETHPRLRVGENIIPDMWKFADMLGATTDLVAANFVKKAGGLVHWDDQVKRMTFGDFGYDRPALHVEREEFDAILVKHAQRLGAQLFEKVTVKQVVFGETQQTVQFDADDGGGQIDVRYVIDASGQGGVLSRQLGTRITDPNFRMMAVWGYFENSRYLDLDGNSHPHSRVMDERPVTLQTSLSQTENIGWTWHIPLRKETSVGFLLPRQTVASLKKQFDCWQDRVDYLWQSEPDLRELMSEATLKDGELHFINSFSGHSTQLAGDGYFIIGDAAGFFDPIFSVGVVLGMFSGSLAAWAAGECLSKPQNAARYQEHFRRQLLSRIELSRGVALPHYATAPLEEERASQTLKFNSEIGMDLIRTVTSMSKRGSNIDRLLA